MVGSDTSPEQPRDARRDRDDAGGAGDVNAGGGAGDAERPEGLAPGGRRHVPPTEIRVSDAERNSAIDALGEHLSAGRLTIDEYGDRSARVTVARTAGDVAAQFHDLPEPHPALPSADGPGASLSPSGRPGGAVSSVRAAAPAVEPGGATPDTRSAAQKLVAAAAAASVFVALALFFMTGLWYWFLLIPAISAIAGSIWGPDWKDSGPSAPPDRRRLE